MSVAPRNAKELVTLLGADPNLRRKLHTMLAMHDLQIEQESLRLLEKSLFDRDIDLSLIDHRDVTIAIKRYYENIRLAGDFIKMW